MTNSGSSEYRQLLVEADERAQDNFDKTVIALSGGGMGVSLAFVDNVVHGKTIVAPYLLLTSWLAWTTSLLVVLISFYLGRLTLKRMISDIDAGRKPEARAGGKYATWTIIANAASPLLFIVGAILMGVFVYRNLGG